MRKTSTEKKLRFEKLQKNSTVQTRELCTKISEMRRSLNGVIFLCSVRHFLWIGKLQHALVAMWSARCITCSKRPHIPQVHWWACTIKYFNPYTNDGFVLLKPECMRSLLECAISRVLIAVFFNKALHSRTALCPQLDFHTLFVMNEKMITAAA